MLMADFLYVVLKLGNFGFCFEPLVGCNNCACTITDCFGEVFVSGESSLSLVVDKVKTAWAAGGVDDIVGITIPNPLPGVSLLVIMTYSNFPVTSGA